MTIIRPTTINARFSQPVGLGGEKLWLCPTLGGDRLDLSGNGNHGTYYGGMGTVADKYKGSRAYDLDGVDDYIRTDLKGIRNYESRTVAFWSNLASVSGAKYFCNWYDDVGGSDPRSLFFLVYQNKHTAGHKNLNATILVQGGVPSVGWKHYAFTYEKDSTLATIYVNGLAVVSASKANTTWQADFAEIGRVSIPSVTDYTQQRCDDIRFFDRALTPSEIKHLASKRGVLGSPRQPYDPLKRTVVRVPAAIPAATKVGSIKKPTTIIKPSYQAGYARNASESENPKLWDGLVGAWMPSLGVTGETLRDVSGNGNHGTLTNMDAASDWVATSKGLALDFDGTGEHVDCGYILNEEIENSLTMTCLCKPAVFGGYQNIFAKPFLYWLHQEPGVNRFRFKIRATSGVQFVQANVPITLGQTYFLTGVMSGNTIKIYVDGRFYGSKAFSGSLDRSFLDNFKIGGWIGTNDDFTGSIGNASVYNRVLSPSEVKQLYVDSLAPFRRKQRVSVAVPAAVPTPSATYHPLRSLAHPLEQ